MSVVLFSFSLSLISYDFSHCSRRLVLIAEVLISFGFSDSFRWGGGSLHLIFCIKKISSVLLSNMIKKNMKKTKEKKKIYVLEPKKKLKRKKVMG